MTIFRDDLDPKFAHFAFQNEQNCRDFHSACVNLAAGRPWNKSEAEHAADLQQAAAEAEAQRLRDIRAEADRQLQEQADADAQAHAEEGARAVEGAPDFVPPFLRNEITKQELWALEDNDKISKPVTHKGELLAIASEKFLQYYATLQRSSGPLSEMQQKEMKDEVQAESFRLWSLHLVITQTQKQIGAVQTEMTTRFFDLSSATGPFSCSAIYGKTGFAKMVADFCSSDLPDDDRRKPQGPQQLLKRDDGLRDRPKLEAQRRILKEVCYKFEHSGLPQFKADGAY